MRRFRNIVFVLAASFWLPAMAHCQLESLPGLEFLQCAAEKDASQCPAKDCSDCCSVEKAHYRAEQLRLIVPTPDALPVSVMVLPVLASEPADVRAGVLTAAPPELPARRHFLFRTALPVRAPSFAS